MRLFYANQKATTVAVPFCFFFFYLKKQTYIFIYKNETDMVSWLDIKLTSRYSKSARMRKRYVIGPADFRVVLPEVQFEKILYILSYTNFK